jgi:hypothetical protein
MADKDYTIKFVTLADGAGADQTLGKVNEVTSAATAGTEQMAAAQENLGAAAAATAQEEAQSAAAMAEASEVAKIYSVDLATAQRALQVLGAATGQATADMGELDGAMDAAQAQIREAAAANAAYAESLSSSAAAVVAEADAEEKLGTISALTARSLAALGIEQKAVTKTATDMGISMQIAAMAMIQMERSALAEKIAAVRVQLEGQTGATREAAVAQEALTAAEAEAAEVGTVKFGRGSPAFHAMVAITNVSRGGAIAMRGWMEAAELAAFAFGGIIGPVVMVSAVVGELVARYEEHKNKGVAAADGVKEAWGEAADFLKGQLKNIGDTKFWDQQLSGAKAVTQEIRDQATALDTVEKAQEKLVKSAQDLAIARLNLKEQEEMEGKSQPEQKAIQNKYAILRAQARTTDEDELKDLEIKRLNDEFSSLQSQLARKADEAASADKDFQQVAGREKGAGLGLVFDKSDYEAARDRLASLQDQQQSASHGYADPATDELIKPLTPTQAIEMQNLQNNIEAMRRREVDHGPSYDEQEKARGPEGTERKDLQKKEEEELKGASPEAQAEIVARYGPQFAAMDDFVRRVAEYNDLKKQEGEAASNMIKAYTENQKAVVDLTAKITEKQKEIEAASLEKKTGEAKGQTEVLKLADEGHSLEVNSAIKRLEGELALIKQRNSEQKKASDQSYENELSTDRQQLEAARAQLSAAEHPSEQIVSHVVGMGERSAHTADLMGRMAEATGAGLQSLKDAVARLERKTEDLENAHAAARNNML